VVAWPPGGLRRCRRPGEALGRDLAAGEPAAICRQAGRPAPRLMRLAASSRSMPGFLQCAHVMIAAQSSNRQQICQRLRCPFANKCSGAVGVRLS
jgi:hypothetical protein